MIGPRWGRCSVIVLVLFAGCGGAGEDGDGVGEVELVLPGEDFLATVCFPSAAGLLRCEQQPIRAEDSAEETAAVIIEALIAGPGGTDGAVPVASSADSDEDGESPESIEQLLPALPAGVGLLEVELLDGVAYVDLRTVEVGSGTGSTRAGDRPAVFLERPAMGLTEELLAVYSLVNSLTANNLGIDRVVLMWNGEQRPTFAGHVDTTRPLMADLSRNAEPVSGI